MMIKTKSTAQKPGGEIVLYKARGGGPALDVQLDKETVWLSQRQIAELFGKNTDTVGLHIRNIFREGELKESATTEGSPVVRDEGGRMVRRTVGIYNRDVIISVGKALRAVETIRGRFGGSALFGCEKDQGLEGSLDAVRQTFCGADVNPSLEEKAASLVNTATAGAGKREQPVGIEQP